jgi:hypothetical protein
MNGVKSYENYFVCKADAIGKVSFSSYRSTATVHMLAYGIADDLVDEYMRMSEVPRINVQVLQSGDCFIWGIIFERTNCCENILFVDNQRVIGISWDTWQHILHH